MGEEPAQVPGVPTTTVVRDGPAGGDAGAPSYLDYTQGPIQRPGDMVATAPIGQVICRRLPHDDFDSQFG